MPPPFFTKYTLFITRKLLKLSITDKNKTMTIYKAPTKKNAPFKHVTDFTNLTTEELFASKDFTNATDALIDAALVPIQSDITTLQSDVTVLQSEVDDKTDKIITFNTRTSSYILQASDANKLIEMNVGSANNLTVPPNVFTAGQQILISQYGAGQTSLVAQLGMTLRSNGGKLKLTGQYSGATIVFRSATEAYVFGDLTT